MNELTHYRCECREGYNGTFCENTPCTWQPCWHNASCILNDNTIRGFECDCSEINFVNFRHYYRYGGELCENGKSIDHGPLARNWKQFICGIFERHIYSSGVASVDNWRDEYSYIRVHRP